MNLGIITTWFDRGAALVSRAYRDVLKNEGVRVSIYARGGEVYGRGNPAWDTDDVTWAPRLGGTKQYKHSYNVFDYDHYSKWLSNCMIDTVLFNEENNFAVIRLTKELGCIVGAYVDYYTRETAPLFRVFDFLICNTNRHYSVFSGIPNCWYIRWGTDVDLFTPGDRISVPGRPVFFHNAGMSPRRKGTDIVLEAFHSLRGQSSLVIHTQCNLQEFGIPGAALIHPRLRIIQRTVPPPGLYQLGDVYLYPSRLDGIGLTLCEALSSGLPTIATNVQPMNEFVTHNRTGLLIRSTDEHQRADEYYWPEVAPDPNDLRSAMEYFIENPEVLRLMSGQARSDALRRFCWKENARGLAGRLRDIPRRQGRSVRATERLIWKMRGVGARARVAMTRMAAAFR